MAVQFDNSAFGPATDFFVTGILRCSTSAENVFLRTRGLVRKAVSSAFLLRRLSTISEPEQKIAIADHANTPVDVHMMLAEDENADVRFALAENHNISRAVLNKLKDDSNPYVADRAARTLKRICMNDSEIISWRSCRTA